MRKIMAGRIDLLTSLPFFAMHLAAIVAVFFFPLSWEMFGLCVGSYYLRMFGITGGYHRYFSHRTFRTGRFFQFLLAFLGTASAQKGVLWWAANHRHHHRYSDQKEDIHSPKQGGFIWSHIGWIIVRDFEATRFELIRDLTRYPELLWLNRYHLVPPTLYALGILAIWDWEGLIWGFLVSTVVLWHGTFTINSLSHVFGTRRYRTSDTSRNNFWLAMITLGEGWHNNHHCYQASARNGFFWWELDITYLVLKGLAWMGIVSDLKQPPLHRLEKMKVHSSESMNEPQKDYSTAAS